MFQVASGSCLL